MTEGPGYGSDQIVRQLGLRRRLGHVAAGLGGLTGATLVGMLWATEPAGLPTRTQFAFAALIVIGLAWAARSALALFRRPLFAIDRLMAAWMALVSSTLMTLGLVVIASARTSVAGLVAAGTLGLALIVAAGAVLVRARAYRATLLAHRHRLELQERNRQSLGPE